MLTMPHILLILLVVFIHSIRSQDSYKSPINTKAITNILNRLTDPSTYDKRLRPQYGIEPVDVGITIHVSSISAVSEVDMDFTIDFYLRQSWRDSRLSYASAIGEFGVEIESLKVDVNYLEKLWKPDTFFPNEKRSFFHAATTHNSFLRIDPDGTILTSQRLTVTATCPMKLQLFPMDSQTCKLELESYGYTTSTIHYHWCSPTIPNCNCSIEIDKFELPSYKLTKACTNKRLAETSSGAYSRLWVEFVFKRQSGSYMLQIFAPATLIVFVSWVSFWVSRESAPSRTMLGTTTVLAETHLLMGTNRRLPPVSYVKALDIYLGFCYLMVVLALLEYACVSYVKKKNSDRSKKQSGMKFQKKSKILPFSEGSNSNICTCYDNPSTFHIVFKKAAFNECCKHGRIDLVARVAFPLMFLVFNGFYWIFLVSLSGYFNESSKREINTSCQ